jgi:RecA/RadA recombinase
MDFLKDIAKTAGNEYAALVSEGVEAGDVDNFIDTGSYIFNALLSGSIYGGLPANKITAVAGESATGKTFFVMGMVKSFLDANPDAGVLYFESESAITKQMVVDRGIDPERMVILPVTTVQEFRTQAIKILDKYMETPEDKRVPMMLCLDSLGMLSTTKEVDDTSESRHNIIGTRLSSGVSMYLSKILIACVRNSCTVVTGKITIRSGSIPLSTTICFVIADSDSKYNTPASGFASRNDLTIPITKNVFPVADSPATAVILFAGNPP